MKNLDVCKQCEYYFCYDSRYPTIDGRVEEKFKYYCDLDESGMKRSKTGFSFKEQDTDLESFVNSPHPINCPYNLEHLVLNNELVEKKKEGKEQ